MTSSWRLWCWKLRSALLAIAGASIPDFGYRALAQITPDNTLGVESSVVTPNASGVDVIEGGATRGANLFHSFEQFSIPTGGAAHFNNALNIQNIISRVTGAYISNIDGLIRANGTANLFLLNPNGIIFGRNATLNIGGSFLASTASSINFADGSFFSATALQATPLLTVNVPLGLQYGANPGRILVQGDGQGIRTTSALIDTTVGLRVQPDQTLAIVGGDVALQGGTLKTAGGRIELGSVAGSGIVSLTSTDTGWALGYEGVPAFGDIDLSQQSAVDASGLGGGDIQVQGRRLTLTDGSQIEASTLGAAAGGTLAVTASESVEVIGRWADGQVPSGLFTQVYPGATGAGGNLTLETGRLLVRDGAQVSAGTFGTGDGGTLSVTAADAVELIGRSADDQVSSGLFAQTEGTGEGAGDAGDLRITTGRLLVCDGAQVSAGTFGTGDGGTLSVTAADAVELIGRSADDRFPSGLLAQTEGTGEDAGDAGNLRITTGRLLVRDGAQVSAGTLGTGDGGTLSVTAADAVELIGTSANDRVSSGLFAETQGICEGAGDAGDLRITTGRLLVRDGAQVGAGTLGTGDGGTLSVTAADAVEVIGTSADGRFPSGLLAQTQGTGEGAGDAGDLTITTGRLLVRDGAVVTVSSEGLGNAGNLEVTANSIRLDNRATLSANTTAGQGNIILKSQNLVLRHRSNITTNATGTASGGNITIDTGVIAALENSDISANAQDARGGRVIINAQGIFGTEFRDASTPESDITASSDLGPQFSCIVEINTPGVDTSFGLVTLPAELADVSRLIATGCASDEENKFIITGRGGLPPNPGDTLRGEAVLVNWATLDSDVENRSGAAPSSNPTREIAPTPIVEAQGWLINNKGEVVLTAAAPTVTPHVPWLTPASCDALPRSK